MNAESPESQQDHRSLERRLRNYVGDTWIWSGDVESIREGRSSAMVTHEYLPFLPHDNWLLEESTSGFLEIVNEDLRTLLLDVTQFWQAVRHNSSLHQCLSSYLQYGR